MCPVRSVAYLSGRSNLQVLGSSIDHLPEHPMPPRVGHFSRMCSILNRRGKSRTAIFVCTTAEVPLHLPHEAVGHAT